MKRAGILFLVFMMILSLFVCGAAEAETPAPTENPLEFYCGAWTAETGDGAAIWQLRSDGSALIPETAVDKYRSIGGMGTWGIGGDGLWLQLSEEVTLRAVSEDGYTKLYCPLLNVMLVRAEEREAAYGLKYVDVQLTDENLWQYFRLRRQEAPVDASGERIWKEVFVMDSPVYDSGLVYWSESDVELEFVYWTTYRLQAYKAPYGVSFYVDDFNRVSASGTLTFVKSGYVADYHCDGSSRSVTLTGGETIATKFEDFRYDGYLY